MKRTLLTIVLATCMFIVYTFGLIALFIFFFSLPNDTAVLIASILALLVCLILAVVTVRRVSYVYTHDTPDKKRVSILLVAILFVIYLFGIESIIASVLSLENALVHILVSVVWFGLAAWLALVTRKKIEEWYRT